MTTADDHRRDLRVEVHDYLVPSEAQFSGEFERFAAELAQCGASDAETADVLDAWIAARCDMIRRGLEVQRQANLSGIESFSVTSGIERSRRAAERTASIEAAELQTALAARLRAQSLSMDPHGRHH